MMKIKQTKSSKLAVKTANLIKQDRALKIPSRKVAKKLALELGLVGALVCLTSCSGVVTFASTEGIEAQNRGRIGLVENGKASPNTKTAYWENENMIANRPSFLQKLFLGKKGAK